ncbi:PLP-dependent aminotransferase family protein [Bradyrhizobium sp. KBS0727]|uniref:aminotransferase-like domain-containing protein n=1 Tax=unclassified Bradyrhizobium TaxID=2631580 RepID=UPI00110E97CD|nr:MULTISPECIES: PLP-dependent aminotransferase family protein [unclassified Bradyrhizobium]QDW39885.1 PLP-dependent aminotransferase family protein [Bradyrhizobium sp. KBS0725]QDW46488.1 PLP-dependent aminotransferase family protein [Bradyrhizobium sp. KBS0727]
MSDWVPILPSNGGPRYLAFVDSLEEDIASGQIKPGMRLLPQREMAQRLGLSIGTISKAYAEAEQRGLISGEVGRGTFVQRRKPEQRGGYGSSDTTINLALNVPPYTGEDEVIASALTEIATQGEMPNLLGYLPHQGMRRHREAMVIWLSTLGVKAHPDELFITHGGQHALSVALNMVTSPGDVVLTERFTYSGMTALSAQNGYRLHGVATDTHGLVPEALDRAFSETGAKALFCMPTLQTPTGVVMPEDRRDAIAEIVREHGAYLLEDDAYAFLFEYPLRPIAARIPDRSFYVVSFAKCLAPGLRIAAMIAPPSFRDRCNNAIRATGWMATPVMAEVVARLIHNGDLLRQVKRKREKATVRNEIASRVLSTWLPPISSPPGFHRWLPLPAGRTLNALVTQAAHAGITLAPPGALQQVDRGTLGIRICLGHPSTEAELEKAMVEIKRILEMTEAISFV